MPVLNDGSIRAGETAEPRVGEQNAERDGSRKSRMPRAINREVPFCWSAEKWVRLVCVFVCLCVCVCVCVY